MIVVNFNLRKSDFKSSKMTALNLVFNYENKRLKMGAGISVIPKFWNTKTQRLKLNSDYPEADSINSKIEILEQNLMKIFKDYINKGIIPEPETLKKDLLEANDILIRPKSSNDFWNHFENFLEEKRKIVRDGDVRDYDKSLRKHLLKGQEIIGKELHFDYFKNKIGGFIEKLDYYLEFEAKNSEGDFGLKVNTIGKQHKNIKAFLNWVFDNGIYPRFDLKHLPTVMEEQENVYLTEKELDNLQSLELEGEESKVRDLFLIGCETAMRYSDFTKLNQDSLKYEGMIYYRPKKTSEVSGSKGGIYVPFSDRVEEILIKNEFNFPKLKIDSITEFNKSIQKICEKAQINSTFIKEYKVAGKIVRKENKKFEFVTSHTARRTFCSLKYLEGWDLSEIMTFSGHSTEKNFRTYLKLDALEKAIKARDKFRKKK